MVCIAGRVCGHATIENIKQSHHDFIHTYEKEHGFWHTTAALLRKTTPDLMSALSVVWRPFVFSCRVCSLFMFSCRVSSFAHHGLRQAKKRKVSKPVNALFHAGAYLQAH